MANASSEQAFLRAGRGSGAGWFLALVLVLGGGCSSSSGSEGQEPPSARAERPAPGAPGGGAAEGADRQPQDEQPAPDHVQTKSYHLRAIAETQYERGAVGQFSIELKPREGWKVNMEYPFSVEVKAPEGVQLPKAKLERADAAAYSEKGVRLDVPMTPTAAGEHRLDVVVDFAVCTPDSCVPETRKLSVRFRVDGRQG